MNTNSIDTVSVVEIDPQNTPQDLDEPVGQMQIFRQP